MSPGRHVAAAAADESDLVVNAFRQVEHLHCALSLAAQCIVIGPVCMFVCGSVTTITRNCVHRLTLSDVKERSVTDRCP